MINDASQVIQAPNECCEIFDDLLEPHVAEYIESQIREVHWKYDYPSNKSIKIQTHWHVFCGHNEESVINNGYEYLLHIWEAAAYKLNLKEEYNIIEWKRLYMNAHTHGIEPHLHKDDGDFTMIYYPRTDWQLEWGGGTLVDGQLVPYVGNSLVVFDAHLPHMAMPVSRQCYELRTCVVFKCYTKNV